MKKTALFAWALVLAGGMISISSCGDSKGTETQENAPAAQLADATVATSLNIRYVDGDSIMANYNLAKDLQEYMLQAQSKLDNLQQQRGTEIQRFGAQIEQKMRNNSYLSEQSYNADVQQLQKMQQSAESAMGELQRKTAQEIEAQQQQLNDSIENFIKEYNQSKGYDAILLKSSGLYFNPALDITKEVVEGLNKRYNKVSDK